MDFRIVFLLRQGRKQRKTRKQNNSVDNLKESHLLTVSLEVFTAEIVQAFFRCAQEDYLVYVLRDTFFAFRVVLCCGL